MTSHEFNKMLPQYRGEMFRYAVFLTGSRDDALDLVQSAFLKALKHQGSFDGINLSAWLFTILKNNFINDYRTSKRHGEFITQLSEFHNNMGGGHADSPESCYLHGELKEIIAHVRSIYRKPFQMLVEGYKYEEIARALDVNIGTIKSRIFRARKTIMDLLKTDYKINLKPQPMTTKHDGECAQETINDIAKKCIADRLIKAIADENLRVNEAAALLNVQAPYLSMAKNSALWPNCSIKVWLVLQKWSNSGLSITKYAANGDLKIVKEKAPEAKEKQPASQLGKNEEQQKEADQKTNMEKLQENAERIGSAANQFPNLVILWGDGERKDFENEPLENVIAFAKQHYNEHDGATIFETKKVYSIENKPVENRY
jgi:RNA polymerase sigma factor (sigma-70 family)